MPAAPLEFRHYLRLFTRQDALEGTTPVRLPHPGPDGRRVEEVYAPPVLQWRFRVRVPAGDSVTMDWSEWQTIPFVREGLPQAVEPAETPDAAA